MGDREMGKACLLWLEALFTIALLSTLTERAKAGPRGEHDDEDGRDVDHHNHHVDQHSNSNVLNTCDVHFKTIHNWPYHNSLDSG